MTEGRAGGAGAALERQRGAIIDPFCQLYAPGIAPETHVPRDALMDEESRAAWPSSLVVGTLFARDEAYLARRAVASDIDAWCANLADHGIARAGVPVPADTPDEVFDALAAHEQVFITLRVNPWDGMRAVRRIRHLAQAYPAIRSISLSPHMLHPSIPPSAAPYYPIYTTCVELDLAVFVNVGFAGPRVPSASQDPMHLDEVCWFFPDLRVVMRHGGEPWVDVCVKLLLKWPNLFYATSGFAPRHYPAAIVHHLNRRGADQILFAGYWPTLSYERIFEEVAGLPLRDEVVPRFLAGNAARAFRL